MNYLKYTSNGGIHKDNECIVKYYIADSVKPDNTNDLQCYITQEDQSKTIQNCSNLCDKKYVAGLTDGLTYIFEITVKNKEKVNIGHQQLIYKKCKNNYIFIFDRF